MTPKTVTPHTPPIDFGALVDGICRQLQECWAAGERVPVEHFVLRNPELNEHPESLLEILLFETTLREETGEVVLLAELTLRFPALAAPLQLHLAFRDKLRRTAKATSNNASNNSGGGFSVQGYEIGREIGRGGMGTVFEAKQLSLNRPVAIKMLSAGALAGSHQFTRFTTEAEAVSRLQHANVVQIFEVGLHAGQPFLALELIDGGTLADRLRNGPLVPRAAAELVAVLARAVHTAHERGIVHRDLKPANVLFTRPVDGAPPIPKLTDFGLAKLLDRAEGHTCTGDTIGTPGYMAPEQVAGGSEIGPATDVYGLGAILYECLTGQPPFRGATAAEVLFQVAQAEPLSPSRLRHGVPRDLQTICLKCLEKNPRRRYTTAGALADDLERFVRGEPVQARPLGRVGRLWKQARRYPLVTSLLLCLAIAVIGGLVGITWKWQESVHLAREESLQRNKAETNLYRSRVAQAALLWQTNNLAAAKEHLALCVPEAGRPDLRGWEWYYLNRLFNPEQATLPQKYWVRGLAISPDGSEVAVACGDAATSHGGVGDGELTVWDLRTRALLWRVETGELTTVVCSPNGRYLACAGTARRVRLFDRHLRREVFSWQEKDRDLGLGFSPDSRHLTALGGTRDGRLVIWDVETGKEIASRPQDFYQGWCPAPVYSPDGKWLLTMSEGKNFRLWDPLLKQERFIPAEEHIHAAKFVGVDQVVTGGANGGAIWNLTTGSTPRRLAGHIGLLCAVAVQPNGQLIATGGADHTIRLWDAKTEQETLVLRGHTWTVETLAFTPDGTQLLSGGQDRAVKVWDLARNPRGRLLGFDGWTNAVCFTPQGDVRLSRSGHHRDGGQIHSWSISNDREMKTELPDVTRNLPWPRSYAEFSSDGRKLISISSDDRIAKIWDADTGKELVAFRGHTLPVQAVAISPDGRLAASAAWNPGAETKACEVRVWDAESGAELAAIEAPYPRVMCLAFNPDCRRLALGAGQSVTDGEAVASVSIWDIETKTRLGEASEHRGLVNSIAFSPDGRRVASVGFLDKQLCLLDAANANVLHVMPTVHSPTCVAYHPSGQRLAVIGYEGIVSLRDGEDGTEVFRLPNLIGNWKGDIASDARVRFSPDGNWMVSSNWNGSLNLWDGRAK